MGKEHWVVCKVCGSKFDASKKGSHYDGNRYTCTLCYKNFKNLEKKDSWFKKNWKLIFGPLFIISGFSSIGQYNWDTVLITFGIGFALLIWHFNPRFRKASETKIKIESELSKLKNQISTCPNCGAKVTGAKCQYCDYINHEQSYQINKLETYINQPLYKRLFSTPPTY